MLEYFCSANLLLVVWYSLTFVMELGQHIDLFIGYIIILCLNCPLMYYNYVKIMLK
jgi:hypothetical protein